MMFSPESSEAIFEMGNVELIELKKSRVPHYVFKGTIIRACGKHVKSNQEMIQRVRKAFDILTTPFSCIYLIRIREVTSMDPTLWQKPPHKARAASCHKKGRQNLCKYAGSMGKRCRILSIQEAIGWTDAFVRYLDHIVQIDISHEAPAEERCRYNNLVYLRGIGEDLQGPPLIKRPGYQEAKCALAEIQKQSRQEMSIVHIPPKERKRLKF